MRTVHLLAIAALLAGFAPADAQERDGVLRGSVVERSGRPIPGAVVTIVHPERPNEVRVTITDTEGKYELIGLRGDVPYVVRVSHPRYRKESLEVRASGDCEQVALRRRRPR